MANIFAPGGMELLGKKDFDILSGKQSLSPAVDIRNANNVIASGFHYISNHDGGSNYPVQSWGNMIVSNGENQRIVQIFMPDNGTNPWIRIFNGNNWLDWIQFAGMNEISRLEQEIVPLTRGKAGEDLNSLKTNQIRVYDTGLNTVLNYPTSSSANWSWFNVQVLMQNDTNGTMNIYTDEEEMFFRTCKNNKWGEWKQIALK